MRKIFDTNKTTSTTQTPATPEQITALYAALADLQDKLDQTNTALDDYKTSIQEGVTSDTITALRINTDDISIKNPLTVSELTTDELTTATAHITNLITDTINATTGLIETLTSTTATIDDLTSTKITVDTINANIAEIKEYVIDKLSLEDVEATTITTESLTTDTVTADTITTNTVETNELTTETADITDAQITDAKITALDTNDIHWTEYQTLLDQDTYIIGIPYFENGSYYVKVVDDQGSVSSLEIENSIGNSYTVRWGQRSIGQVTKIYSAGNQIYFQGVNTTGSSLKLYFASICSDTPEPLDTYDTLPVYPESTYDIATQNGTKFYSNISTPMTDPQSLTVRTTADYKNATTEYTYDMSEQITAQVYKPNQSVNTSDTVEFYEVHAPVLDVAELTVGQTFTGPHIKDVPNYDYSTAPDGEYIDISAGIDTGTIPGDSYRLVSLNVSFGVDAYLTGYGASAQDVIAQKTYAKDGPTYTTNNGYTVDNNYHVGEVVAGVDTGVAQINIVVDDNGMQYLATVDTNKVCTLTTIGAPTTKSGDMYDTDLPNKQQISLMPPNVGDVFYIELGTVLTPITIVYTNTSYSTVQNVPFTKIGDGGILQRVTVDNGTVTKADIPAIATTTTKKQQPLQYNDQTKELQYTDNLELDTLQVEGDTTINGDLYVKGTTHTTDTEDIVSGADTIVLRANNDLALGSGQVAGLVVNKYDGTQDLNLVTDNEGTLRVGTGAGTDTTYNNVLFDASTNKWYSYTLDSDNKVVLGAVVNIDGTVTSWTNRRVENTYTVYDSVIATVIDKTTLVPLLGRAEDADLTDKGLLAYDKANLKAVTANNADVAKNVFNAMQAGTGDIQDTDTVALQTGTNNPVKRTMTAIVDFIKTKLNLKQLFDKLSTSTADIQDTDVLVTQTGTADPVKKTASIFWSWVAKKIQQNGFTNSTNSDSPWFNMTNSASSGDTIAARASLANGHKVDFLIGSGHENKGIYTTDAGTNGAWLVRSDNKGSAAIDMPNGFVVTSGTSRAPTLLQSSGFFSGSLPTDIANLFQVPIAGSVDSGSFNDYAQRKSFIGSHFDGSSWYNLLSVRHRNGSGDGTQYGMQIRAPLTVGGDLQYRQQLGGTWLDWISVVKQGYSYKPTNYSFVGWISSSNDIDALGIDRVSYVNLLKGLQLDYGDQGLLIVQWYDEMSGIYLSGDTMCIFNPGDTQSLNFFDTDTNWTSANIDSPTWSIDGSIAAGGVRLPVGRPSNPQVGDMWLE